MDLKYKNISGSVKDVDAKKRIITGYLSNFGNKDHDQDIIEKGAFTKSLKERKDQIYFLNQHRWHQPHGKFSVLTEDAKGLYFESTPMIEGVSYSDDAIKLYEAGIINEHSIGYSVVKGFFDNDQDAYILKELKLYEGSNVTRGANPLTPYLGSKSLDKKTIKDEIKKITKAFRNGTFTDETFGLLEIALNELNAKAFELGQLEYKKSLENIEHPSNDNEQIAKSRLNEQKQIINEFLKNY